MIRKLFVDICVRNILHNQTNASCNKLNKFGKKATKLNMINRTMKAAAYITIKQIESLQ